MKKITLLFAILFSGLILFAQKKITTSATIAFDATTGVDKLPRAENKTVIAALDPSTGTVQVEASVKNFAFENPMMQEHFNSDKWMNSDKYPKFSFTGRIDDPSKVNFAKDGVYDVTVTGNLSIRELTKPLTTSGKITVKGGQVNVSTTFSVNLSDYAITGVPIDAGKVSAHPKITIAADLK